MANCRITANKYARKAKVKNIKVSKSKEFFIFEFDDGSPKGIVGYGATQVYYGNKTYLWLSLLLGYFLPSSYNINTDNVIGKECFVVTDAKGVVRSLIPIIENNEKAPAQEPVDQTSPVGPEGDRCVPEKSLYVGNVGPEGPVSGSIEAEKGEDESEQALFG